MPYTSGNEVIMTMRDQTQIKQIGSYSYRMAPLPYREVQPILVDILKIRRL